jgi:hypothetical protein
MRDIGNGDTELKATPLLFTPNRIIKISRVFPINGDKGHIAQIDPMMFIGFSGLLAQRAGLSQDFVRPFPRNTMGADGHIDLKPGIKVITEHFNHLPFGTQRC